MVKKKRDYENLANVADIIMYNNLQEVYHYSFSKFYNKFKIARNTLEAIGRLQRAADLSLRIPFSLINLLRQMHRIRKERRKMIQIIIPKCAFNFKLLQLETMRLIKRNGLRTSAYDRMCILLVKIAKNRAQCGFGCLWQNMEDWRILQKKMELFDTIKLKLQYRLGIITKRNFYKLRYFHLRKVFFKRGLHLLVQLDERKKSEAYYYMRNVYLNAPEEFWEWQGKKKS